MRAPPGVADRGQQLAHAGRREDVDAAFDHDPSIEHRHAIRDAAHLLEIVRHHQHGACARRSSSASRMSSRIRTAGVVETRRRLVEDEELRLRIERVREQHAAQLAAREHGERPLLETRQADALEQPRDREPGGARDAEADRPPLAREREKVGDGDRQRRIDREALRHVADRAGADPVHRDSPVERDLPEDRREQRALAGAVGAHHARGCCRAAPAG